jgi:hypothetical protein
MESLSVRSLEGTALNLLAIFSVAIICSFALIPRIASATEVTLTSVTATTTPVYTNTGLATTTRARTGDAVHFQLTLSDDPSATTSPIINIQGMGSTTMTNGGVGQYWYSTSTLAALNPGALAFHIGFGGTAGEATTTITQSSVTAPNVTVDNAAPTLSSVSWTDTDSSTRLSGTDTLLLTWSETMATTTLTSGNINTVLGLTNSHTFSTTTAPTWNTAGTQLTITLGAGTTVTGGDTVQPTTAVKDAIGNTSSGAETALGLPAPLGISALTATSTPAYTNTGFATTTRATTGDAVHYQLTLDGTPLVDPQINISSMGSTTMSGSGVNWYYSTTTISGSLSNGAIPFKVSVGAVGGTATTTATQADLTGTNVTFDKTGPTLNSLTWTDADSSTQFSGGDTLLLTWSETMATTTLTGANLDTVLALTNSHTFSTTTAPTWNTAGTQLTITLGAATTVTGADTIQPTSAVKDAIGNADATVAATDLPDSSTPSNPTGLADTTFRGGDSLSVSLVSTGSSQIRYTTDGTTPDCSTGTVYSSALTISTSLTLKAIGCDEAGNFSSVVTAIYTRKTGGGGGGASRPPTIPAVPATKLVGCVPGSGDLFDITSGKSCTVRATPASPSEGCSSGNLFNTANGKPCTNAAVHAFQTDLTAGSLGDDVKGLQTFLNTHGYSVASSGPGSRGNETSMFGGLTRAALVRYQKAKGITPAVGYFGPKTRASINAEQ